MNINDIVLTLDKITKTYKKKEVLKSVDLSLKKNTIISIFGKNGTGKSTLFKILLFLAPYTGKYFLSPSTTICGTVNEPSFYKQYTGIENLYLLLDTFDNAYYTELITRFNMNDYIETKPVKAYSAGMKQRLANLYVLLSDADILIFDEPQNSLDQKGIDEFFKVLLEIKDKKTIIFSTHSTYRISDVCDDVYSLVDGKLVKGYEELKEENLINYAIEIKDTDKLNKIVEYSKNLFPNRSATCEINDIFISLTKQEMGVLVKQVDEEYSILLKPTFVKYEERYE